MSEHLERVHRGLGEMQHLARGVGDLQRMLGNVKTRGTWGEVQLDVLLDEFLAPGQYERNVATRPGSAERVDFAVRLPGNEGAGGSPVWLPIDAKFPLEDYLRLQEAEQRGDAEAVAQAGKALEVRLRTEARSIREKYVQPPRTTDFAVLFLPTESLYATAAGRVGLLESLQREHRITLSGPTTVAALLSSLQLGFRTLAIEARAGEVRALLSQVSAEVERFGQAVDRTRGKLASATGSVEQLALRTRSLEKALLSLETLPPADDPQVERS